MSPYRPKADIGVSVTIGARPKLGQGRPLAQSVSSARAISRSAHRRIADARPRMSVYQPKTDPIPSRRECTFLTQ
jgi:hypothetical protein